jgi:Cellulase (glycosyl hydrolase family 5)
VANAGNAVVTITWAKSSGAATYNVQRGTQRSGPYTKLASPAAPTYTDSAVTNGTMYYYVVSAVNAAGQSADSAEVSATPKAPATTGSSSTAGSVGRPSYNTGTGLFVLNGILYDSNSVPFKIRGTNLDQPLGVNSQPGLSNAKVNAVRFAARCNDASASTYANYITNTFVDNDEVAIPVLFQDCGGNNTSGSTSDAVLTNAVNWWVSAYSALKNSQKHLIIDIANEWGAASSSDWETQYASAIAALRAAGYTCPIMIDSGFYAQDLSDLTSYAATLLNADPQKNLIFSMHSYGNSATLLANNQLGTLASLSTSTGAAFALMEFGPDGNVGPDPTNVPPASIINAADTAGIGWASWAWDDGTTVFDLTVTLGVYTGTPATAATASQLTPYGQQVVPYYSTAAKATDFP